MKRFFLFFFCRDALLVIMFAHCYPVVYICKTDRFVQNQTMGILFQIMFYMKVNMAMQ